MKINVLDHQTIDKIAAGEVVERPSSVVKELVENAIDSGADAVTVEIKDGGISFIRVTDNGGGIEKTQIRNAFLRHATSKITSADDLTDLVSLGFRGEALASIAAVSMVEAISRTEEDLTGVRYVIEGGMEKELEEVGAPGGTTIIVRNLFYNTLPRKKFLKQPQTEGSYVADLMEHLALSHPQISFHFIMNGQNRFHTSGNNDLKEIIYRIYGKDIARELDEIHVEKEDFSIDGFLGRPVINRANRNYELFYINGRFIKSNLLGKAVEEGYKEYLMQHKFPFCVLHFTIDTGRIDVNVHPTKMEVRIAGGQEFYERVRDVIFESLHQREMIPEVTLPAPKMPGKTPEAVRAAGTAAQSASSASQVSMKPEPVRKEKVSVPEPFETRRIKQEKEAERAKTPAPEELKNTVHAPEPYMVSRQAGAPGPIQPAVAARPSQMELFDDKLLSKKAREHYEIIGQLFETYWLISYQDKLMIIDQHAAHEKVKYERLIRQFQTHSIASQNLNPPLIVTLSGKEKDCLLQNREHFRALGFEIEEFGGNDYAISSVPMDLYGYREAEFFYELLDELAQETLSGTPDSIRMRIATAACKAAVKGNMRLNRAEAEALIDELLSLDNPYNCPHGRPTIISMSKYELEKKFKRIG
ncbi:MAG: DNA mismatch repair endonuclease MutL [Ruminococcus sp.]|nr:DNA mismatch repair endonuclease MutL [Ruminococcus sp.]